MRKLTARAVIAGAMGLMLAAAGVTLATPAVAQLAAVGPSPRAKPWRVDNLPNQLADKQNALRQAALSGVLSGRYSINGDGVVDLGSGPQLISPLKGATSASYAAASKAASKAAKGQPNNDKQHNSDKKHSHKKHSDHSSGQGNSHAGIRHQPASGQTRYVELQREATDRVFVVLAEFGDLPWTGLTAGATDPITGQPSDPYSDPSTAAPFDPNAQRTEGPLHNQLPQPDRAVNNWTVWRSDFSQSYFQDFYFGGGESLKNYYETQSSGRYSVDGTVTTWVKVPYTQARYGSDAYGASLTWALVRDAANIWYADQLAQGRSEADVNAELASFDVWDRYDYDGDGDFHEPDGYIDHFQIVHAGGDEAEGDPIYAGDALMSHRWYAYQDGVGSWGPDGYAAYGGSRIGNSNLYIGDYTLQPENGGRSIFYHEYAHDLGLPDDYNIISGGDNNNEHWTLMAQSRLGARTDEGIGERGGDLGAWNKAMLGWLNYTTVNYDEHKTLKLGPQEYNTNLPQALVVTLPDKNVDFEVGDPYEGGLQWYSGHHDNSTLTTISRTLTVPADDPTLSFQARYDIEAGYDYAYVAVNSDIVNAWDGTSGVDLNNPDLSTYGWEEVDTDLSTYAGQTVTVTIAYQTDPGVGGNFDEFPNGLFIDAVTLGGVAVDEEGWTASNGFALVAGAYTQQFAHFYIAGWRSYVSYDRYLQTGPFYFGYAPALPDKVDHYPYQDGLLISYYDTSYDDNDTIVHPGAGRNLYIDAHPKPLTRADGSFWRARVQVYDAPFSKDRTDRVTLHEGGVAERFGGLAGVPTFRDTDTYWYPEEPNHGVKLPGYGVTIRVLNDGGGKLKVKVN